ncbi:MAG: EAL domain-containing protein [Thiohalomonadales bacterium]
MKSPKLIVIDDEIDLANLVAEVAERAGYESDLYHYAEDFKRDYRNDADVIVLDLLLPGVDGVEVIRYLAGIACESRLILMSGFDSGVLHSAQKLAVEQGLNFIGSFSKPFRPHELFKLLANLPTETKQRTVAVSADFVPVFEDLNAAIMQGELVVHYQPTINLQKNAVSGLEALVRWQHPQHGLLFPDQFIPLAEQSGLIDDLTWVVLEHISIQYQEWRNYDWAPMIGVNMSANTLKELDLPEKMRSLLQKYKLQPSHLILEITETALMQELIKSLDVLTRLRMSGLQLSIDDFGTGYSSLVQLHRAPFSEIKIDRSFIMEMLNDKEAHAIVETVILLGHKLGMKVVAEGVETLEHLTLLNSLGCDLAQGYYISRPIPGEQILPWLNGREEGQLLNAM